MLKLFVSMQTYVTGVLNRDRGATAVEYGLLVGLIAAVIIVVVVHARQADRQRLHQGQHQPDQRRHYQLIREFTLRASVHPPTVDGSPRHGPDTGKEQPAMRRRTARNAPRDRGAAAVEFALLLPMLLLLVFGIIDFGRALNAQITLTQAAREGARLDALGQPNPNVVSRTQAAATGLNPVGVAVTSCPANAGAGVDATVKASFTFTFVTPVAAIAAPVRFELRSRR